MTFAPTDEQLAIIAAAQGTEDNLIVSALAGAAKTSTLQLIAEALPKTQILYLAFNKKNAVEAAARLPDNCQAMTLNALGHRTWADATGLRLRLNSKKNFEILSAVIEEQARRDREELYKQFAELLRLVAFGKACGYIPTGTYEAAPMKARRLMDDSEFFTHCEQKLTRLEQDVLREATLRSIKLAFTGEIDFDDQILMPTVFHGAFPRYKLTLVDEAQDLSALNHATLRKMCGTRRLIAVGDPCQAIYGFRGAHEDSMALLCETFSAKEMRLTTSFRCPIEVTKHVHWRAPDMRWPDWAKTGSVRTLSFWSVDDLPENAAIICRNNAPLFGIAIRLLKNGRTAELDGKDVIKAITKIMRKFGGSDLPQHRVIECIRDWRDATCAKNKDRAHARIKDQAACMLTFAEQGATLGDALSYAQHVMSLHSPLKLMTGHKSKGLEFSDVFFLDQELVHDEGQDINLRYVICTRAMENLTYINSENFLDNDAISKHDMVRSQSEQAIP